MSFKVVLRGKGRLPRHSSYAMDRLDRKSAIAREQCLQEAEDYCRMNGVRGWKATQSGLFLDIKDLRTINKRLDGKIVTWEERRYCSIYTDCGRRSISSSIHQEQK